MSIKKAPAFRTSEILRREQGRCSNDGMIIELFVSKVKNKQKKCDYEKVPLLHPGRMKTGAAFNQQNDYTLSVSKVKGICKFLLLKTSSPFM